MRIRTIKPEFWSSKTIAKLDPWERLLFLGLLNYADDEGRGLSDPRLIRSAIFPLEDQIQDEDVDRMVRALRDVGLVTLYRARARSKSGRGGASDVLEIRAFAEHQRVDRPRESLYPAPKTRRRSSTKARRGIDEGSSRRPRRNGREEEKEVGTDRGIVDPSDAGSTPNGAGVYDPEAVYVPGPDDPKLFEEEPELEATEPKPKPSRWKTDPDWNPWAEIGGGP